MLLQLSDSSILLLAYLQSEDIDKLLKECEPASEDQRPVHPKEDSVQLAAG
jgi:hypothetical protein